MLTISTGIISALAFSSDQSGSFAAGTYSGSVCLYDEDSSGQIGHLDGIHPGGVTQVNLRLLLSSSWVLFHVTSFPLPVRPSSLSSLFSHLRTPSLVTPPISSFASVLNHASSIHLKAKLMIVLDIVPPPLPFTHIYSLPPIHLFTSIRPS